MSQKPTPNATSKAVRTPGIPTIPTMIDHVIVDPRTIQDFHGRPLYTVTDREAQEGKMLKMFTDEHKAAEYGRSLLENPASGWQRIHKPRRSNGMGKTIAARIRGGHRLSSRYSGDCELYQDINYGGILWDPKGDENGDGNLPDFRRLYAYPWTNYNTWYGWRDANDQISSFDLYTSANWIKFYRDINYGDPWIALPGWAWADNLVPWGWNDIISSIKLCDDLDD